MKQQLSPKGLIEDFQREWPQLRALLPELPVLLKAAIEQQIKSSAQLQAERVQAEKSRAQKSSLQTTLGMSAIVLGIAHSLIMQHPSMADTSFTNAGPWVAAVGAILLLLKR